MLPSNEQLKLYYAARLGSVKLNNYNFFTPDHITTITNAASFPANAHYLLNHIDFLKWQFTAEQIVKIANYGQDHLLTLVSLSLELKKYFSSTDIINVLDSKRGTTALKALHDNLSLFICYGISIDEMISIARHEWADKNLNALAQYLDYLEKNKFSISQIVAMVNKPYGYQCLALLVKHYNLLTELHLSNSQIFDQLKGDDAVPFFEILSNNKSLFLELGFSCEQIRRIVTSLNGHKALSAIIKNYNELKKFGLNNEHMVMIVESEPAFENIEFILQKRSQIKQCGFTLRQFIPIVKSNYSVKNLKTILENYDTFKRLNFTGATLYKLAMFISALDWIKEVIEKSDEILKIKLQPTHIIHLMKYRDRKYFLKMLIKHAPQLLNLNFDYEYIIPLVYYGGLVALEDAITFSSVIDDPKIVIKHLSRGEAGKTYLTYLAVNKLTGIDFTSHNEATPQKMMEMLLNLIERQKKYCNNPIENEQENLHKRKTVEDNHVLYNDTSYNSNVENIAKKKREGKEEALEENHQANSSAPEYHYTDQEILQMVNEALEQVSKEAATPANPATPHVLNHSVQSVSDGLNLLGAASALQDMSIFNSATSHNQGLPNAQEHSIEDDLFEVVYNPET